MTRLFLIIIVLPLLAVSCVKEVEERVFFDEDFTDIATYMELNKEKYSKFYTVLIQGGMKDPLSAYNPFGNGFTLFVPTDEAVDRFVQNHPSYNSFEELLADKDFVRVLGRYHLVNIGLETNEFPYGALPDTTATGDYLTIGFSSNLDSTVYKVNNIAPVIEGNLEMLNGYVHIINEMLQPVNYSGYDWLEVNPGYSILQQALEVTGIKDSMGIYRTTESGQVVLNTYTILVEHDSIFSRNGINNIEELIGKYGTPSLPLTDPNNDLYQFAAYHVMEGSFFLVDFENSGNYNTFATSPLKIETGLEVRINPGIDTFRLEISPFGDTTAITHISLYYQESNILTKNGAIHFVDQVMEYYTPNISSKTFNFYEEPEIFAVRNTPNTYFFDEKEQNLLEVLSWTGPEFMVYYKSSSTSEAANNDDYIYIEGNFTINYVLPKILPGKYTMYLRAHGYNRANEHATVYVYLDGTRRGNTYNLNQGGTSASNPYRIGTDSRGYKVGSVEFTKYKTHVVKIETLIPGEMYWDNVSFVPEK